MHFRVLELGTQLKRMAFFAHVTVIWGSHIMFVMIAQLYQESFTFLLPTIMVFPATTGGSQVGFRLEEKGVNWFAGSIQLQVNALESSLVCFVQSLSSLGVESVGYDMQKTHLSPCI